jgi:hypothetical protein
VRGLFVTILVTTHKRLYHNSPSQRLRKDNTMRRTTPRQPNPYREVYKKYAETQFTLEEILEEFKGYTIYSIMDNTTIYIVHNDIILISFDSIGYEDEDCIPILYEAYPHPSEDCFNRITNSLLEDGCKPTKLN